MHCHRHNSSASCHFRSLLSPVEDQFHFLIEKPREARKHERVVVTRSPSFSIHIENCLNLDETPRILVPASCIEWWITRRQMQQPMSSLNLCLPPQSLLFHPAALPRRSSERIWKVGHRICFTILVMVVPSPCSWHRVSQTLKR